MSTGVIGIRHGEVDNPKQVIYAGLDGYGLSPSGRSQAAAVADALRGANVVAVYSSPLDRAVQTATPTAEELGLEVRRDERLYEWKHWQQWAGMTWEELRTKGRHAWDAYRADPGSVTAGESLEQLADRVESWLTDVRDEHRDGIVVGFTHLEPLRAILLRLLGRPAVDLFDIQVGPGQGVRIAPTPDATPMSPSALHKAAVGAGGRGMLR